MPGVADVCTNGDSDGSVMRRSILTYTILSLFIFSAWSHSEDVIQPKGKTYRICKLETGESIKLDGLLTEPAWAQVEVASDFITKIPRDGEPAMQRTEIRMIYDDKNIYVALVCWQTVKILVTDLHRDFSPSQNDDVEIVFDTFHDHRNAFNFVVSPFGSILDIQFTGDSNEVNKSWNGVWDAKTHIYKDRWTAEIVIPFKTLRFSKSENRTVNRRSNKARIDIHCGHPF